MKKLVALGAALMLSSATLASIAHAASSPVMMTDHSVRTSRLIGMTVFNDQGDRIGKVEDVLLAPGSGEPRLVLSVGEYLGQQDRLVAVPLSHVKLEGAQPMMAGATKQQLARMPVYLFMPLLLDGSG